MNQPTTPYHCPNCGNEKTGKFCSACGQKDDGRYNMHLLWHEAIHAITHADKGIFSYSAALLYKPGVIARDIVEGKRKRYFNPFQYLLIILGIYVLIVTGTHFMEKVTSYMDRPSQSFVNSEMQATFDMVNKFQKFIYLALIPLSALVVKWLFPKSGDNYAEHLVGFVVYYGNSLLVHSLVILLSAAIPPTFGLMLVISSLLPVVYMLIYFRQFYRAGWLSSLLKSLLYLVIFIAIVMFITMVVSLVSHLVK